VHRLKHPRPGVPDAAYDRERVSALVQRHLTEDAGAGGEQFAGHEQFGHSALAGAVGHRSGQWWPRSLQPSVPFWLLPAPVTMTTTSSGSSRGSRALGSRQLRAPQLIPGKPVLDPGSICPYL
jgi:hypothetical protein